MLGAIDPPLGRLLGECAIGVVDVELVGRAATGEHEDVVVAVVVEVADDPAAVHRGVSACGRDDPDRVAEPGLIGDFDEGHAGLGLGGRDDKRAKGDQCLKAETAETQSGSALHDLDPTRSVLSMG